MVCVVVVDVVDVVMGGDCEDVSSDDDGGYG